MKNLPLLIITLVGTVALIVAVAVMFSKSTGTVKTVDQTALIGTNEPSRGPENAKVTIVEFSDFQCPACKAMKPLVDQIVANHPNDVRMVYRYFPLLSIHKYAQVSAQAGAAAAEEGKFWEMYNKLFETQETWEVADNDQAAKDIFIGYAEQLGIDKAKFTERIDSDSVKTAVSNDLSYGTQIGVNATPTIFVNGQEVPASDLPRLSETVEALLK